MWSQFTKMISLKWSQDHCQKDSPTPGGWVCRAAVESRENCLGTDESGRRFARTASSRLLCPSSSRSSRCLVDSNLDSNLDFVVPLDGLPFLAIARVCHHFAAFTLNHFHCVFLTRTLMNCTQVACTVPLNSVRPQNGITSPTIQRFDLTLRLIFWMRSAAQHITVRLIAPLFRSASSKNWKERNTNWNETSSNEF